MNDSANTILLLALLAAYAFLVWQWRRASREANALGAAHARLRREDAEAAADHARETAMWRALGTLSRDLLLAVDSHGRVRYANPAAVERFGPLPAEPPPLIEFARSLSVDELAHDALRGTPGADLVRVVEVRGHPYRARAGRLEDGAALALTDATEVQRLERARRDFIANISHELRTPLTSIRLVLEGLLSGVARTPAESAEALMKIHREAQALEHMAQELLDLSQIESGRAMVRMAPTPVRALVEPVVARLQPQAAHKRQSIVVDAPEGLAALADLDQVGRALGNLLHNAVKFTPPEGLIRLSVRASDGDVIFEVADSGPGLPPEDLARVFERFFRGDRSRSGGGTGLGLAIAKHVVEAHGGRIWAESDGVPGHGAVFRFSLPAAEGRGQSPTGPA